MVHQVKEYRGGFYSLVCNRCKKEEGVYRSVVAARFRLRTVEGWHINNKRATCGECVTKALDNKRNRNLELFAEYAIELCFECVDIECDQLTQYLETYNLIQKVEGGFNPEKHNDFQGDAEEGDEWYEPTTTTTS